MSIQLVVFELDGKEYGLDVSAINGILLASKFKINALPGTHKTIEGMINLRGKVNFIFNLRIKFGLEAKEISVEDKFIMLNTNNSTIGCMVDEVTDIVNLNANQIQAPPSFITNSSDNYISGIGKVDDRMIIILKPEQLFASELATLEVDQNSWSMII